MAYMSQENKKELAPAIKAVLKKYGVKGTLSVNNHSTLVLNIKTSEIDFISNYNEVAVKKHRRDICGNLLHYSNDYMNMSINEYWYKDHFDGVALDFLTEVIDAMMVGNHNNSDYMTDYFDVGWYIDVNIGRWDKPYVLAA